VDALEQYLRTESCRPQVGAEQLRQIGRKAAVQFVQEQVPLATSIPRLAKEASLNDEQTKRVLEFANNMSFSMMFKSGFEQNITFPLADPAQILQKSEAPVEKTKQASVDTPEDRYVPGQELTSLESAFEAEMHKTAAAEAPDTHALTLKWLDKTAEVRSLRTDHQSTADQFVFTQTELDVLVKQALADGNGPHQIGACMSEARPNPGLTRYLRERYDGLVDIDGGLAKLAEGEEAVLPENPVTDAVQKLEMLQQQLMATQEAVTEAQQQVDQMIQTMQAPIEENPADKLFQATPPPPEPAPPMPGQPMQPGQEETVQPVAM
jgi:hypothetical protein